MFGTLKRFGAAAACAGVVSLAVVPAPASAHEFKIGKLEIEHPWSRATPGGAAVAAGYLKVENDGDAADRLISITSEISERAEIHEMATKDGVMTMRPVSGGVEIPAKGEAAFAPNGYHVMFQRLKRPLKTGETFPATLTFETAGSITVTFAVQALGSPGPDHDGADHDRMDMDPSKMKHGN